MPAVQYHDRAGRYVHLLAHLIASLTHTPLLCVQLQGPPQPATETGALDTPAKVKSKAAKKAKRVRRPLTLA